ncbi:MAG: PTS transporter subunit EIIC [Hungatella sp.]|jgi:PTS system cellobiose-specific IIC component|nr:PTS transporter subunit EIIC [Hungatella sp.]MDR2024362.1 PTS transporter subunit EIIC [Hungatella sp.]
MKQLIHWLEHSFAPKMNKINNNVWVTTLKDSIMQVLPFILLGSIFCFLTVPGEVFGWQWWPNFWTPFGWTMGLLSLFIAFLIPFNLMEKKRLRKQRIIAALTGVVAFLIIISPQVIKDGVPGFSHASLGAGGMFVAITAGVFTGFIMGIFGKFSFFKEDSVIPDFVRAWFDSMLPIGIVACSLWVLVDLLGIDIYNILLALFMPISNVMQTPWGFALSLFLVCFLYSMGISSWVLTPVYKPAMLMAITANVSMAAAGTATHETLNLVTDPTVYSAYLWIGGIGCTLPLVIMLIFAKSNKLRALGRACLAPAIFNINEPVVFGCIAWNPIMMIPMWLIGIVLPAVVWFFTKVIPFAPIPKMVFDMWYCPFPISTWLTTGSIKGIILMVVCALLSTVIWYPFFRIYDSQEVEVEKKAAEKK